jgi:hypothetical protein
MIFRHQQVLCIDVNSIDMRQNKALTSASQGFIVICVDLEMRLL